MTLKLLTGFAVNAIDTHPAIWVNPERITHVEPRVIQRANLQEASGTFIYFGSSETVIAVREPIHIVISVLLAGGAA